MKKKHALIIGGTGMLAEVSETLAAKGYHISVVARNQDKMDNLIVRKEQLTPLMVDYHNTERFRKRIRETIDLNGPVSLVVNWSHSSAPDVPQIVIDETSAQTTNLKCFHVLGSSSDPVTLENKLIIPAYCEYYCILLGFKKEKNKSRWLTHQEISQGVLLAMEMEKKVFHVGLTEPWVDRP